MRIITAMLAASLSLGLSGCQHLNLMQTESTASTDTATPPTLMRQLLAGHRGESIRDYPAACLAHSKLSQPSVVGQVIDTPRYAMLTLTKQQQPNAVMGGELCILNKITHHVEITAVDDLRFVAPASNPSVTATMP